MQAMGAKGDAWHTMQNAWGALQAGIAFEYRGVVAKIFFQRLDF